MTYNLSIYENIPNFSMAIFLAIISFVFIITACSQKINIQEEKEAMMNADRAFSKLSVEKGTYTAFSTYMVDDAIHYVDKNHPLKGREQILKMFNPKSKSTLEWEPFKSEIAASGDLGYSLGNWVHTSKDSTGKEVKNYGCYCSIWKKQEDGSWKYVYDAGISTPKPLDKK